MEKENNQISCMVPEIYHLIDKEIFMSLIGGNHGIQKFEINFD
jgi:hypothetical protein